jgi:multidrug efflux pump
MPLVFVTGAGAKARNSIGLVLVGGMTIGTIFTLFIVPSLYVLIAKTHNEGREAESESLDSSGSVDLEPELPEPALARDGNGRWSPA